MSCRRYRVIISFVSRIGAVLLAFFLGPLTADEPTQLHQLTPADIRAVLEERRESVREFRVLYTKSATVQYAKISKENLRQCGDAAANRFELIVEPGRIYSTQLGQRTTGKVLDPLGVTRYKFSWNGNRDYSSAAHPNNPLLGRNGFSRKFIDGPHAVAGLLLAFSGLEWRQVFGGYDRHSDTEIADVRNPLRAFDRIEKTGRYERLQLSTTQHQGRQCVKMELLFDLALAKPTEHKEGTLPVATYVLDPSYDFQSVRTILYGGGGVIQDVRIGYSRDEQKQLIPASLEIRRTVRYYQAATKTTYAAEDLEKTAVTICCTINESGINEEIGPETYESENVFVPGAEIWDNDAGVNVTQALAALESDIRLHVAGVPAVATNVIEDAPDDMGAPNRLTTEPATEDEATLSSDEVTTELREEHSPDTMREDLNAFGVPRWLLLAALALLATCIALALRFRSANSRNAKE